MSMQADLYQQVILDHNKKPRNFGVLEGATHKAEGYNPLCGDHIWVAIKLENGTIADIKFEGEGCAICKASSSMMTTTLKGKSTDEAELLVTEFQKLVKGEIDPEKDSHSLGRLAIFSNIWKFPARVKCAALAWHTVRGAMNDKESISTE